jgi:hypothetical protein
MSMGSNTKKGGFDVKNLHPSLQADYHKRTSLSKENAGSSLKPLPAGQGNPVRVGRRGSSIGILASKTKDSFYEWLASSGLGKLMKDDPDSIHHEDFDAGVNAMALLCALLLSVPYDIIANIDKNYLNFLRQQLELCSEEDRGEFDYELIYATYRGSFLATVYMSISGMILATFYFLFKRTDEDDYKQWRKKARWLVISLFLATALAICSLILLTNMYFDYYLLSRSENICNNGTTPYVVPGLFTSLAAFCWGFYLII